MSFKSKAIQLVINGRDKSGKAFNSAIKGLKRFAGAAGKIAAGIAGGFSIVSGALVLLGGKISDQIDEQAKIASSLGLANDSLGVFRDAAGYAGISSENLTTAFRRMSQGITDAANGTGEAKDALERLGLDAGRLLQDGPEKAFIAIIEQLDKLPNGIEKTGIAMDLFGRSGAAMANLTAKGLRQAKDDADSLKLKLKTTQAAHVEAANDAWARIKNAGNDFVKYVAAKLAPGIKKAFDSAFEFIKKQDLQTWAANTALVIAKAFKGTIVVLGGVSEGIIAMTRGMVEAFKVANEIVKRYSNLNYKASSGTVKIAENNLENMKQQGVPESNYYYQQAAKTLAEEKKKADLYLEMSYQAEAIEESLTEAGKALSGAQGFSQSQAVDDAVSGLQGLIDDLDKTQEDSGNTSAKTSGRIEMYFAGTEGAIKLAKERTQEFNEILEKTGGIAGTSAEVTVDRLGRISTILDDIKRKAGEAGTAISNIPKNPNTPDMTADYFAETLESEAER